MSTHLVRLSHQRSQRSIKICQLHRHPLAGHDLSQRQSSHRRLNSFLRRKQIRPLIRDIKIKISSVLQSDARSKSLNRQIRKRHG